MPAQLTSPFPCLTASQQTDPPQWAMLERHLLQVNEKAAALMIEKHCAPGGMLYYAADVDDYYEKVYNWGLLYAMGANKKSSTTP